MAVGLIGFIPYFWDILRKRTKPHAFSWLVWATIMSITFYASFSTGGGAGSWVVGATALACLSVFVVALFRGEKDITLLDKLCLSASLLGIVIWVGTANPLSAVIIVSVADAAGFVPTFRKTYRKPHEETLSLYALNGLGLAMSLFALQTLSLTTVFYPTYTVVAGFLFVTMVLWRRHQHPHA